MNYHTDPNPYGTPTSLGLVGPQESIPSSEIDLSAIPDSPLGRGTTSARGALIGAIQLDRESTKSESPELRASVHEIPPAAPIDVSGEQSDTNADLHAPSTIPSIINSASQPVSVAQNVDEHAKNHRLGVRKPSEKAIDANPAPERRPLTEDSAHAQNVQIHTSTWCESDPIFDPIESDTESFREKQQMQSAKRLRSRSNKTPTATFSPLRASNVERVDRRDGEFIVPAVPQSRMEVARKSLCEVTSSGQRREDSEDANISVQNGLKRHTKHDNVGDAHSKARNNDRLYVARDTPKRDTGCNNLVDETSTASQATTACSQVSNNPTDGTAESSVQRQDNSVLSQSQAPNKTIHLNHDADIGVSDSDDCLSAQEVERLIKEAEGKQTEKTGQKKVQETNLARDARERRNAAKKGEVPADKKGVKEDRARVTESTQAKRANASQKELTEAKRMEETAVNEVRSSGKKKISERLALERQISETLLAEEANKLMLAEDGAKQIEAEKEKLKKARREEPEAKEQANEAKADEHERQVRGKDSDKKAREAQRAREKAQKLADFESKDAKGKAPPARTVCETATTVREEARKRIAARNEQRQRESSERQSRASTNPATSSKSMGPKRSMTPRIPGPSVTIPSPHLSSLRSSPPSIRSSGNMEAPIRSALRQTPGAVRRSASSVSFDVPPRTKLNAYIASTPKPKSLKEINDELATKPSPVTNLAINPPRTVSNPPSKTPTKTPIPKKVSERKIVKTPAKNGKVQTKLKVTRELKKLKGRAVTPMKSTQTTKHEIVLSSGEDSSTSEETLWQTGNAEAGPSSRKPTLPAVSQRTKTAEVKSSGARIDPNIRNVKIEKNTKAASASLPRCTSSLDKTTQQKSTSRSPALALSETISVSSGLASSTASVSDLESDSEDGSQVRSLMTSTGTKSGTRGPVTKKGSSQAVNEPIKRSEFRSNSKTSSQSSSQVSSSRSYSSTSVKGDGEHMAEAADKQLQLESQHSIPNSRVSQASSTINGAVNKEIINQGLDHAGRLSNGIRPANYKYPSLSELQKLPRAVTPKAEPRRNAFSSQPTGASPVVPSGSDSSSSDSENSSSNSDEDETVDGPPSQTRSRKTFPGMNMKGVLKRRLSRTC